jgi:integrase
MPKRAKPLNAKQLENWKPDPVRTLELADGAVPGLSVRLTPNGEMSWSLHVMVQGVRRRIAIGKQLRLAEARRKAEEARLTINKGIDPTAEHKASQARRKAAEAGIGTLGLVIAAYYEHGPGVALRSGIAARALIERMFADHLSRPALDVRSAELQLVIDGWRSKSSAFRVAACFRPLARWATKRGLMIKGDPLEAPTQRAVTQRVLTRDEVGLLWSKLGWWRHDIAARFMLLTSGRRDEICGATWAEINLETAQWVIPAARRKDTKPNTRRTKEDHVIPLPRQCVELLERLKPDNSQGLVFVGERGAKLSNWPRWTKWVEKRLGIEVTPHSLRRTCVTLAGDLGVAPHVVSALLGHRSIGGSLLAGYNQSRYTREVGIALQQVADLLDSPAAGDSNILIFRVTA